MQKFSVSVIMPALNEEENVAAVIDTTLAAFVNLGIEGEVIVVNDGSTDNTRNLVKQKMETSDKIHMIEHPVPQGIGASFWDGVDSAKGDIALMLPADNENDPYETLRYISLLEHVDIAVPFAYNKNVRSLSRNIVSFIYRAIINTTFMTNFNYTNSTVIYRRSILKQLDYRCAGFFFQTDILIRLVAMGYLFGEVPYRLGTRSSGSSKALTFSSFIKVAKGYLRLVRDVYFSRALRLKKYAFTDDSVSFRRYKEV